MNFDNKGTWVSCASRAQFQVLLFWFNCFRYNPSPASDTCALLQLLKIFQLLENKFYSQKIIQTFKRQIIHF